MSIETATMSAHGLFTDQQWKIYNWMIEWGDAEHIAKELGFQRGIRRIRTIHHKRKERSGLTSLFGITGITVSRSGTAHGGTDTR